MSDRIKGTLVGIAFSLAAIGLWIILGLIGFIAGIAGALMGILFLTGYKLVNKSDMSKYAVIFACILIAVEVIIANLITIAIYAGMFDASFADALSIPEIQKVGTV